MVVCLYAAPSAPEPAFEEHDLENDFDDDVDAAGLSVS